MLITCARLLDLDMDLLADEDARGWPQIDEIKPLARSIQRACVGANRPLPLDGLDGLIIGCLET